ncbi:MAG TPA: iron donor protein CyaY [Blastocatellia bacterium]|nr:iron donor protein CyaY [Blastocatellia bacterium]
MSDRISDVEFQKRSEQIIGELERAFGELAEERDIDVQVEAGVLTVSFEEGEPGRFIVSPNSSVRQLWVSARMGSYKFDWVDETRGFVLAGKDEALKQVLTRLTREQLGDSELSL